MSVGAFRVAIGLHDLHSAAVHRCPEPRGPRSPNPARRPQLEETAAPSTRNVLYGNTGDEMPTGSRQARRAREHESGCRSGPQRVVAGSMGARSRAGRRDGVLAYWLAIFSNSATLRAASGSKAMSAATFRAPAA